ncbi:MAG TPA: CopD family protein [Gemmatimonadaceae bacterium]|nr:CopD family protein [Gemmatimonadaceae bacterium]
MTEIAVTIVVYALTLTLVGASTVRSALLRRADRAGDPLIVERLRGIEATAWLALVLALAVRAWAHTATVFGPADSMSVDALKTIALVSRWGEAWRWQMMAALVGAAAICAIRGRAAGIVGACATLALVVALARGGHTEGMPTRMVVQTVHILGGGAWLGTLGVVAAISGDRTDDRARLLRAFFPLALAGVATLAATGVVAAYTYVGAISNLWTTSYGRTLVAKLSLVAGALGCGYVNWRSLRRPRAEPIAPALRWELMLAAAIVIATGILTELAHP